MGDVDETKMAKAVVGFALGLPFSVFAMVRVEVAGAERTGAPGMIAEV